MPKPSFAHNQHPLRAKRGRHQAATRTCVAALEAQLTAAQQREAAALARVAELESRLSTLKPAPDSGRERLDTLLAICSALLVIHDVETILQLISREVTRLFPCTSSVLVFLVDPHQQQLALRATSNGQPCDFVLHPDQVLARRSCLSPRAMLLSGPELQADLQSLLTAQIEQAPAVFAPWPPTSILLAPLRIEDQRLGVLMLCSATESDQFHPCDLPFIQTLADLSAVAISEAQQRERATNLQRDLAQIQSLHAEAQARLSTAQAQLLQSAKLAAVGELAASVAHEINNPLYAARNSLYLVEQDIPPDAPQRPFLEIAQNELGRIARIITRMRDFYRPTRAELTPTNVNKILIETVELVQTHLRHNRISITSELTTDLPPIIAHADQLRQVFLNLMLNACDAMPDGGCLHLTTGLLPPINDCTACVIIRITDTGTGIAPEHLPHLFEPFYTTKPQGTGLGLAISAHIVSQHDGQISVESTPGTGTTFVLTLPVITS
mgnify:CR=1 FL=1